MKHSILIVLFSMVSYLYGQQIALSKSPFAQFIKSYDSFVVGQPTQLYSMDVLTEIYANRTDKQSMTKNKGLFLQGKGNEQYYQSGRQLFVQNDSIRVVIDTIEKQVILTPPNLDGNQYSMDYLKNADSTKYQFFIGKNKNQTTFKVIELEPLSSNQEIEFVFDNVTKIIHSVTIVYWPSNYFSNDLNDETVERPFMTVQYSNYKILPPNTSLIKERMKEWLKLTPEGPRLTDSKNSYHLNDLRKK